MDFVEERDFADQGPLTDRDMEEDAQILATLIMKLIFVDGDSLGEDLYT
jgi:hypothetical protein